MSTQEKIYKVFKWLAFAGLAALSCSWTAMSFMRWLDIDIVTAVFLAIAIYVGASFCFSAVANALDKFADFDDRSQRRRHFVIGLVFFLALWSFGLVTNAHNFIYKTEIEQVAIEDLTLTKDYLEGLNQETGNLEIKRINDDYRSMDLRVHDLLDNLLKEYKNPDRTGIAALFERILLEIEDALGDNFHFNTINPGNNMASWNRAYDGYKRQAEDALAHRRLKFDKEILEIRRSVDSEKIDNLVTRMNLGLYDIETKGCGPNIMRQINQDLKLARAHLNTETCSKCIIFKDGDKEYFSGQNVLSRTESLKNADTVIGDYFKGKYESHGFLWKFMLSLLVDLLAFGFFHVAKDK